MPKAIREAGPLTLAPTPATAKGAIPIVLISPGWGSSGHYSAKVLENAVKAGIWRKGHQLFLDHPGEAETYDRPERSVRDLGATLAEDARWDPNLGVVGEAVPFGDAAKMLADKEFLQAIGVSIRAYADSTIGEAEGRKGQIITQIVEAISTDFVTRAGRGGRVLVELMESARPEQVVERAVANGVQEATANDTRDALGTALKDAYGGEKTWTWVRDFDDTTVWYQFETPDGTGTYAEQYEIDDAGAVTLSGSPVEVRARTEYVPVRATESAAIEAAVALLMKAGASEADARAVAPEALRLAESVPAPAGQPNTNTPNSEEETMGHIQVDEAEHGRLAEAAGRVPTLEAERDTAQRERDSARHELALYKAREAARPAVTKKVGESTLPATRKARIVESVLRQVRLDENGAANADELVSITENEVREAETEMAEIAESLGVGSIRGFGITQESGSGASVEDFDNAFKTSQEG